MLPALVELERMQLPIALGAGRNAGILETMVAARCTDAGCIRVKKVGCWKALLFAGE